jgi:hypothetical protein
MPVRALIIAIEKYPNVSDGSMAKELPGTLAAGQAFRAWLTDKWTQEGKVAADTQLIFCSEPKQPDGEGAARSDVLKALRTLQQNGQNATDELYFFFSGHGFSFERARGNRADVLVTSDYEQADLSGECCINYGAIVNWLRAHLGPGLHYHFVDACRNLLDASKIQISQGLPFNPQTSTEASIYILQSAVPGEVAAVGGPFPGSLMKGLKGAGIAKAWAPGVLDEMYVRYESLRSYLAASVQAKQQFAHRSEGTSSESEAVLAVIKPIPNVKLTIRFVNAAPGLTGRLITRRGRELVDNQPLDHNPVVLELEPDRYTFSIELKNQSTDPASPVSRDIYDDQELVLTVTPPKPGALGGLEAAGPPQLPTATLDIALPQGTTFELRNMSTGLDEKLVSNSGKVRVSGGRYMATLRGDDNRVIKRQEVELATGLESVVDLFKWHHSAPHIAIAQRLEVSPAGVSFSESLGRPEQDADLDTWLALLGAGRILGTSRKYEKIAPFPLHDFLDEAAGASPVYVLAGFEDVQTRLEVAFSRTGQVQWSEAPQPRDLIGVREAYHAAASGPLLVSFRTGDVPYTIASLASPNRAMLITYTLDDDGAPQIGQYLLPLEHLIPNLNPTVRDRLLARNLLMDVRTLARANREFRKRRDVFAQLEKNEKSDLISAQLLDPIALALAAYELIRRGKKQDIGLIVRDLERYFPDLPDTAALKKLAGETAALPAGVSLFMDGLRAFPEYTGELPEHAARLPLPAGHLDFGASWTSWRAAVSED